MIRLPRWREYYNSLPSLTMSRLAPRGKKNEIHPGGLSYDVSARVP